MVPRAAGWIDVGLHGAVTAAADVREPEAKADDARNRGLAGGAGVLNGCLPRTGAVSVSDVAEDGSIRMRSVVSPRTGDDGRDLGLLFASELDVGAANEKRERVRLCTSSDVAPVFGELESKGAASVWRVSRVPRGRPGGSAGRCSTMNMDKYEQH